MSINPLIVYGRKCRSYKALKKDKGLEKFIVNLKKFQELNVTEVTKLGLFIQGMDHNLKQSPY